MNDYYYSGLGHARDSPKCLYRYWRGTCGHTGQNRGTDGKIRSRGVQEDGVD